MRRHAGRERVVARRVRGRWGVLLIPQLDGLDVCRTRLGVDHQDTSSRIAVALRGEEGRRELHLAGA